MASSAQFNSGLAAAWPTMANNNTAKIIFDLAEFMGRMVSSIQLNCNGFQKNLLIIKTLELLLGLIHINKTIDSTKSYGLVVETGLYKNAELKNSGENHGRG